MNNAQATMSGARKTGDMGWARGKDAIMPTLLPMRHARQHLFRMLQQSFLFPPESARERRDDCRAGCGV
ncbi:hypothetical protein HT746_12690 [Burkholderia pyrrocinia]|uniref:hypothetical protein n=1 Tax=Burkholderia pyrrocinia TaxID=60550 RepID=UPI0015770E3F|nr:hypothetical protein [Burkholderia pyrrocinia]NTX27977.1 hypothetical protein [Burkholderia pyrrocinia]